MINKISISQRFKSYLKNPLSLILFLLVCLAALSSFIVVVFIIGYILVMGVPHITPELFSFTYTSENASMFPAIVNTITMITMSLVIAVPIGIFSAIYLVEYAKRGNKLVEMVRITAETLSGIPSIVYGLFGYLFFVTSLKWSYSLLSGAFTLAIMILPLVMRTTEEALKVVPPSYREASLGLGATRFQTLYKVILPSAIPGILSGVILSMGRVIGESAALFLTAGTVYKIPASIMSSGRTLTVHAFLETKEKGDIASAAAAGIVLIIMILLLNLLAKFISKRFNKANY